MDAHLPYFSAPGVADLTHADGSAISTSRTDFIATAAAGSAIARIVFPIVDDSTNESAETFRFSLDASRISGGIGTPIVSSGASQIITIAASDPVTVTLAAESTAVNEGQPARFTVTLSNPSAAEVTVPYSVTGASFTPTDANSGSIRIAAGATSGVITIGIPIADSLGASDPSQTLTVTLGDSPSAAGGGGQVMRSADAAEHSAQVTVTFLDVMHSVAFTNPATRINEGAAATTYTVTRTGPAIADGSTLTVTWAYAAGSPAPAAADFMGAALPAGGTLAFTGSETTKTFMVATAADTANEPDEAFTLTLRIADGAHATAAMMAGGVSLPGALNVVIADDDPVTVEITRASGSGSVAENSGALDFTVTLAGGTRASGVSTVVPFTVTGLDADEFDISAPGGILTTATGGTLTIAHGSPSGTITVRLNDDNLLNEAQETMTLAGGAPGSAGLRLTGAGAGRAQYTSGGGAVAIDVTDTDDIIISVAADSATATEGGEAVFTVTLSKASVAEVKVEYLLSSSVPGIPNQRRRLTFAVGAGGRTARTAKITVPIPPTPSRGASDTETLVVEIGVGGTVDEGGTVRIGGHTAAGRIDASTNPPDIRARVDVSFTDTAHAFTLSSPAAAITEGDSDADTTYTLARSGPAVLSGQDLVVTWAVTAGSATTDDFSAGRLPGGTLTFAGDDASKTFDIGIEGDNLNEADETFTVTLRFAAADMAAVTANGDATLPAAHQVTITDDDAIALAVTAATAVSEGGNAALNLNLGAIPTSDVTVGYNLGNTAAATDVDATLSGGGADLTDPGGGSVTIAAAAGLATAAITLGLTADNLNEAAETFTVTITAADLSGHHGTATIASGGAQEFTIAASDPISVAIAADADSANEGGTAQFTVRLEGASNGAAADIEVAYTTSGLTAAPTDANSGSITIAAGATSGALALGIPASAALGDGDRETLRVTLGAITAGMAAGSVTGGGSAQVTVNYRSAARTLTVTGPASLAETDAGVESGDYTVTLTGAAFTTATTVTWTVTDIGTATADFVAASDRGGTVSFATTDASKTFTLTIAGDALNEGAEAFTVQVSVANSMADSGTGIGAAHTTTIADDDTLTVTLSGGGAAALNEGGMATVMVALSGATATADVVVDYSVTGSDTAGGGQLTIATGTTSGMFTVAINDDALAESEETFTVTATASSAGEVTVAAPQTFTIAESDALTVTVAAASDTATTGGSAAFTVRLSNPAAAVVTVNYTVSGVVTDTGSVDIPAGASSGRITVAVPADAVAEGEEGTLTVTLTGTPVVGAGGGSASLGTTVMASITVTGDDAAARAARVTPAAVATARGIGQLAARAVGARLGQAVAGGRVALNFAGRNITGERGLETAAAHALALAQDGAPELEDLLRRSSFSFNLGGDGHPRHPRSPRLKDRGGDESGGGGLNLWGGGDYLAFEGDHDGVDYDGGAGALHFGLDAAWGGERGLIGVAVSMSNADTDFSVTSAAKGAGALGTTGTLESAVTSVHPYITREFERAKLYFTVGYGSGDADVKEADGVAIETDLTVTTAAVGLTRAPTDLLTVRLGALYSRAELAAAETAGRRLEEVTVDATRVTAGMELSPRPGRALRPFLLADFRHNSGDGDTGFAGDVGGGFEYRAPTLSVRLAGSTTVTADSAEEQRLAFTARKTSPAPDGSGLALGLNLDWNGTHIDTARLLTGEWRF